jgi:hypothetical protein
MSDNTSLRAGRLQGIVLSHNETDKSGQTSTIPKADIGIDINHQTMEQGEKRFLVKFSSSSSLEKIHNIMDGNKYRVIGDESRRQFLLLSSDIATFRERAGSDLLYVELDQVCLPDRVPDDSYFADHGR